MDIQHERRLILVTLGLTVTFLVLQFLMMELLPPSNVRLGLSIFLLLAAAGLGITGLSAALVGLTRLRKKAEDEQCIHLRLAQLVEAATDGILLLDKHSEVVVANRAVRDFLGSAAEPGSPFERWSRNCNLYLSGSDEPYPPDRLPIRRALDGEFGKVDDVEVRQGEKHTLCEVRSLPIHDQDRPVEYVGLVFVDISDRSAMERHLFRQKELFEKLAEVARHTTSDPSLEVTLRNALEVTLSITGAEHASLFLISPSGTALHSLLGRGEALRTEHRALAGSAIVEKGLAGWVFQNRQPALVTDTRLDERWVHMPNDPWDNRSALIVPIEVCDETLGVLGVYHRQPDWFNQEHLSFLSAAANQMALVLRNAQYFDEERQLVDELRRAQDISEAASQAKTQFLARMSQELRSPLTTILGYSNMLLEQARQTNPGALQPHLKRIETSAHQLLKQIDTMLQFSDVEAGRTELALQSINPAGLVYEAATAVQGLMERNGNQLRVELPGEEISLFTDPNSLRQILDHLLENACKVTMQGAITLSVHREQEETGCWVAFTVADTGIGMDASQAEKLFAPLSQGDPLSTWRFGEAGLGLAISRHLARSLGGDITHDTKPGEGSVFTLRLKG